MEAPIAELMDVVVRGEGDRPCLDGVTVSFARGSAAALVGRVGGGKTTLLRLLAGLALADEGVVRVDGLDLGDASYEQLRAHQLRTGFVFESGGVWANRTVEQNIALPLLYHRGGAAAARARVEELARELDLTAALHLPSFRADASVVRRMLVARALVLEPALLLCDEPQLALVPREAQRVAAAIERRRRERQMTVVYTDHDGEMGAFRTDSRWYLSQGRLTARPSEMPPPRSGAPASRADGAA